ncbi:MAG: YlxR family protein [Actinomycetota bacterium]
MERGATTRIDVGPLRTCSGCRRRRSQAELIRVVRSRTGEVVLDPSPDGGERPPGRGAYVCPDEPCVDAALRGGLKRALKHEGSLPGDLRERLLERISAPRGRSERKRWQDHGFTR